MLNTQRLNTAQFNQSYVIPTGGETPISGQIAFNSYSLDTDNIILKTLDFEELPESRDSFFDNIRKSGRTLISKYDGVKNIVCSGDIVGTDTDDLYSRLLEIKKNISKESWFEINIDGKRQKVKAILSNAGNSFDRPKYPRSRSAFDFRFTTTDSPYFQDLTATNQKILASTVDSLIEGISNEGTAMTELNIFITINSATDLSKIEIENTRNSNKIVIEETFSASDFIQINATELFVELNGSGIDYSGRFLELEEGINDLQIDITSTAHNVDYTFQYFLKDK